MSWFLSQQFRVFLWAATILLAVASCRRLGQEAPDWEAELLTPLLHSQLSIRDLIADSLLQVEEDHALALVYSSTMYQTNLKDLNLQIPDTSVVKVFSLQNISLSDKTIVYPYSLGALCQQLGLLGQVIIGNNGQYFSIPPLSNLATPDNPLDATAFFEHATIESGFLDITLKNGYPLEWSNIVFEIRNYTDQQIVARDTFLNLVPGSQQTKSINLAGKQVEGKLLVRITNMNSPGGYVLIDTSAAIVVTLAARAIRVSQATAIFPAQNLIDQIQNTTYLLSGGAELKRLHIKSGKLGLRVISSIDQDCYLEYALPSATHPSGQLVFISKKLPGAPPGGTTEFYETFDLSGYLFDLTGLDGTLFNTFYSHLILRMDSTGELVTLTKGDSIRLIYELKGLEPESIHGYLGQQILSVGPQVSAFQLFPAFVEGALTLKGVKLGLELENGIGAAGRLNLYQLEALGRSGSLALAWTELGQPLALPPATEPPLNAGLASFELNDNNSNISELISLLPQQIRYRFDVFLNPFGNTSGHQDFAYADSYVTARLSAYVPLSLAAERLSLNDTLQFSLASASPEQAGSIKEGTFSFHVSNGFPLQATVQVYFCTAAFVVLDSLFGAPQTLAAASLDAACRVSEPAQAVLSSYVDADKMHRLRQAERAIVRVVLDTNHSSLCPVVRLYDTYLLNLVLSGRFIFKAGT
ncbi:MAG: hypothetical protein NZL95_04190 [Chitinophagales bacterium]|nr:hypothetical protein [Chitinophagales bacterium]MDW8427730.1 hypothetical protein [Chitinophagales bacterium]